MVLLVGSGDSKTPILRMRTQDGEMPPPNDHLERIKWLLGVPNSYYRSDAD
jgi:hypothetical protein